MLSYRQQTLDGFFKMDRFKSVNKAISVLKCFNPQNLELSASEISKRIGMHRVTSYRLLETLLKAGLLEKKDESGRYRIGPELYVLGSLYLSTTDLLKAAGPVIDTINELTGEATNVGLLEKGNIIFIMRRETQRAFRFSQSVGTILPAHASAMGKAILSQLDEETIDNMFPHENLQPLTKKTIATKAELKLELKSIRKTGVALEEEGCFEGVVGIGSVIRNASGEVVAAMSIALPIWEINNTIRGRLATLVKFGASLISYRLGYQDLVCSIRDIQELRSWWEQHPPNVRDTRGKVILRQ